MSSTDQNKAVVRRFITETLDGGNVDVIDSRTAGRSGGVISGQ